MEIGRRLRQLGSLVDSLVKRTIERLTPKPVEHTLRFLLVRTCENDPSTQDPMHRPLTDLGKGQGAEAGRRIKERIGDKPAVVLVDPADPLYYLLPPDGRGDRRRARHQGDPSRTRGATDDP